MSLSVQYGNMDRYQAAMLHQATPSIDSVIHEEGSTEPWVSQLVADFVVARGARTVLETGCFKGATSVYLHDALCRLGEGKLHLCDLDPERVKATADRLQALRQSRYDGWPIVEVTLHCFDILAFLRSTDQRFDIAWVDDCHEKAHVTKELTLLYPLMNPGGLIMMHDIDAVCDLRTVVTQFGGYSITLPRLGPSGGLGVIQISE